MKNKAARFFAHCYRYLVVHQSTFDTPKSILDKHFVAILPLMSAMLYLPLNKEYFDPVVYSRDKKERVEGFIVGGQRIKRLPDNERLFTAIEETINPYPYDSCVGFIREIWWFNIQVSWRGHKSYTELADGSIKVIKEDTCAA